jgi:hypothetical protein
MPKPTSPGIQFAPISCAVIQAIRNVGCQFFEALEIGKS